MRRTALVAATALGALALSAGTASAVTTIPTTIDQQAVWGGSTPNSVFFAGNVRSPRHACIEGRTVKVFIFYTDGTRQLLDTDLTSEHGAWSGGGNFLNKFFDHALARVVRKPLGRHHRRVCSAASTPLGG
jgi:hypothetical protein